MTGVRISFSVVDATAKTEAAYNSASAQPWVDYNTLKDGLGSVSYTHLTLPTIA